MGGERKMILYLIITALIILVCVTCFKGKINKGIVVVTTLACIASACITSVVKTVQYHKSPVTAEWIDTTYSSISDNPEKWQGYNKVFISKKRKDPAEMIVYLKTKCDVGLLWDIRNGDYLEKNLVLNAKQYEIYKAYKDSLDQRKDSLEKTTESVREDQ